MKAFGLPRYSDVEFPDAADIRHYALNRSKDSGRAAQRSNGKRQTRQLLKGAHRTSVKAEIRRELLGLD